jgi:uncharacterized protein (TIGR04255 family)
LPLKSRLSSVQDIATEIAGFKLDSIIVTATLRADSDGINAAEVPITANDGDQYPHLPRAPIVEAVVEWRTKLTPTFDISKLKQAGELLVPKYQFLDEVRRVQFVVKRTGGSEQQQSARDLGVQGYRFRSDDRLEIATFKQDGFSFSRLKPYTRWDSVFSETERLWGIYRSICQPEEISRIAVRYINRISLPLPISDFGKYLTAPPVVPPNLPQLVTSLFSRFVLHEPQSGISTSVTQVIEGNPEAGNLPLILDIDAYIAKSMNPNAIEISPQFAMLREMKNRVFFGTLTDTAIGMFR